MSTREPADLDAAFVATTYLFVPGDRPERFEKALASGADAVIVDLEDAVTAHAKPTARAHVVRWLERLAPERPVCVRINAPASAECMADVVALAACSTLRVMPAKCEDPDALAQLADALPEASFIALIESAKGVANAFAIARAPRVRRLAFGALDYCADLGLDGDPRALIHPMSCLAIASRAADLQQPVAAPTAAIDDEERLRDETQFAHALGFTAKLCIHPRQVPVVAATLAPSVEELAWAARIVAVADGRSGVVAVDGHMVDAPVIARARAIMQRVRRRSGTV